MLGEHLVSAWLFGKHVGISGVEMKRRFPLKNVLQFLLKFANNQIYSNCASRDNHYPLTLHMVHAVCKFCTQKNIALYQVDISTQYRSNTKRKFLFESTN